MSLSLRRVTAAAALVAAFALVGCQPPAPPAAAGPAAAPPPVSVAAALTQEVLDSDEFPARIEPVEAVKVRARVNGYLQRVLFRPGTEVKQGDVLFEIDRRPFAANLAQAQAAMAATVAQLDLAKLEAKRQNQMLVTHATSRRESDAAAALVKSLEASKAANAATLANVRLNLEFTRVTAPISGRVGKDEVTVGNLVQGENPDSPVLTTLVSVDPVYVAFEADERAFLKYITASRGEALTVAVGLSDESGFPHRAKLEFVDNNVDTSSGTVRMRALLDNHDRRFTPGLFARVRLEAAGAARRVILVADRAIGTDQSKRYVLVVGEDKLAAYREVHTGRKAGDLRIVESGLQAGELVVVNGLQRVRPGSPVTPTTIPMVETSATSSAAPAAD